MGIEQIFDSASSVMTVVSFTTFIGILLWTCSRKRSAAFASAASLPFADDEHADVESAHG